MKKTVSWILSRTSLTKASAVVVIAGLLMSVSYIPQAAQANDSPYGDSAVDKIDLCHDESGDGTDYHSSGGVNVSSVVNGGHGNHATDIIPPFHYQQNNNSPVEFYAGLNWNITNEDIWNNGACDGDGVLPTPPPPAQTPPPPPAQTPPPPTPTPPPPIDQTPCVAGPAYAATVISSTQGTLKDGSAITDPLRTDPSKTLGAPDTQFFSIGKTGTITLSFAGYPINIVGNDVSLYEITNGRDTYPEEKATVEVSQDGLLWVTLGTASGLDAGGISSQDLNATGFSWIKYVRVTDSTNFALHEDTADGYDLDAVMVNFANCAAVTLQKSGSYNSNTGEITYTVNWAVVGTGSVNPLTITDVIPTGTTYVAGSANNGGSYDSLLTKLTWNLGLKAAGSSGSVTFKATVDSALAQNMWAKTVVHFSQGKKQDLTTAVDANRSDPTQSLGAAESLGLVYDNPLSNYIGKFVSLGFTQGQDGGEITVAFDHPVFNGAGNDLQLFEVTTGDNYPDESVKVEVSSDNSSWSNVGVVVRDGAVDLGANASANYVRVTGVSDKNLFTAEADNFDVDAIKALQLLPQICSITNTAQASWPSNDITIFTNASTVTTINQGACNNPQGSISGVKWSDANSNGIKDNGESLLSGWTIFLDTNDNGTLDLGEQSTTTNANGAYTFSNVPAGMYIVREVQQANWSQTYPDSNSFNKHVVFVTNAAVLDKNFGNHTDGGLGGSSTDTSPVPPPPSGGGGGGGGGGGAAVPPPPTGGGGGVPQVLGDSTGSSVPQPQVLGASTGQLPRTGTTAGYVVFAILAINLAGLATLKRFRII